MAKKRTPYLSSFLPSAEKENSNVLPFRKRGLIQRVIDDPYDGSKRAAVATSETDVLAYLQAKGKLQYYHVEAGNKFWQAWETLEMSGSKSVDFGREPVDGGRVPGSDNWTDARLRASDFLRNARRAIGEQYYELLRRLLIERHRIDQVATAAGCNAGFVVSQLKAALERLAGEAKGQHRKTPQDKYAKAAVAAKAVGLGTGPALPLAA